MYKNIYIVIATSLRRTNMLIKYSLQSVYLQKKVNLYKFNVLIVDDNRNLEEFIKVKKEVKRLRRKLKLKNKQFETFVIKNKYAKFNSGTGAWNTAIDFIYRKDRKAYIVFLDDDDWFDRYYLYNLKNHLNGKNIAVFSPITWKFKKYELIFNLDINELTPKNFYIKNPGVQASNMCFRVDILKAIGGFDGNLPSTTDRDLMIRFLSFCEETKQCDEIKILDYKGVYYNAENRGSITKNRLKKHKGLKLFYQKHKHNFSSEDYKLSLQRAKKLFDYDEW